MMRDLAQQSFERRQGSFPKPLKFLVLLAIVLGALVFVKDRFFSSGISSSSSASLHDAPKGLTAVPVPNVSSFGDRGISLTSESANFTNVSADSAKATASRKYGDGTYSLSVSATLPALKGDKYQVWIITDGVKLAGTMEGSGTSFSLVFRDNDKYSKYDEIWITREITSNDEKPEKHILEGRF